MWQEAATDPKTSPCSDALVERVLNLKQVLKKRFVNEKDIIFLKPAIVYIF